MADIRVVSGPDLTTAELYDLLRLRVEIFVVEQDCPYSEIDGRDLEPSTKHLWRTDDAGITSALRLLDDPIGIRIGRVVTRKDSRGIGLSASLMRHALELNGDQVTVLDAQTYAQGFYEKFGYVQAGPQYLEDGIPHIPMQRPASTTPSTPA